VSSRHRVLAFAALGVVASARLASAQCPDGTPPPCGRAVTPPPRSIAVLTFENVTRDTAAQYLAEGLPDQILTRLGGVGRLTVVSRTVVRRLRNADQLSVQQIGRALNAAYLINGTIRAAGGRVHVSVEALRSGTGEAIWSETFDRATDSLLGVEEAVATAVATGVAGRLSPRERRALGSRATLNGRAYAQFLRGNVLLARRTPATMWSAIQAYRGATEEDSTFADAFGRLATAYTLCVNWGCGGSADTLLMLSRQAATRALQLDPHSSDGWMGRALGLVFSAFFRSSGPAAGDDDSVLASFAAFRRALALNPRNDEAWHQYGFALSLVNDSAAFDAYHRALALDPTRAVTYGDISWLLHLEGHNERALATVDSGLALEPEEGYRWVRVLYRVTAGDTAGALADAQRAPNVMFSPAVLAAFAHDTGATRMMRAWLAARECVGNLGALYLLWIGQQELAIAGLLPCGPSLMTRWQLRVPLLAPLLDDPRIRALRAASDSIAARARWR